MVQPHILCDKGDLAKKAIVVGDPARVHRVGELLEDVKQVASNREFTSIVGKFQGEDIAVVSTGIGGPSAAIAVEEMVRCGVEMIVRVGSCGSMQTDIKVGDLIIPDSIIRGEGTTRGYVDSEFPAVADSDLFVSLREAAQNEKFSYHTGTSLTIDSLYSETTPERKKDWSQFNVIAQEMEGATVLVVSRLRKVKAGCVFLVVNKAEGGDLEEGIGEYTKQSVAKSGDFIDKEKKAILTALNGLVNTNA